MSHDPNCIFCKIVAGQIPSKKAYEDEDVLAFHDIHPWAPVHLLIIPKRHIASMADVTEAEAGLLGDLEADLTREALLWRGGFSRLLTLALTEAWVRRWTARLEARSR